MPRCVYCGKDYEPHKGVTLVGKDGNINYLCSSKCRKNREMKRRKVRWVSKVKKGNEERISPKIKVYKKKKKKVVKKKRILKK